MLTKAILCAIGLIALVSAINAQTKANVEETLKQVDFRLIRVAVANPKPGAKSASSFIEVYGGFAIKEISGCTVTLRNEGRDKRRRFIYDVVIPIGELESQGSIGESPGAIGSPGSDTGQEFYPWSVTYDVKGYRRKITLHDRVRKRILARGAHVGFNVKDRNFLDRFIETFTNAIRMCQE